MTDFVLHLGLRKTATTTLQRALFAHHSQIFYLGRYHRFPGTKECRSQELYRVLEPAIWKVRKAFDLDAARRAIETGVLSEMADRQVPLGSWESLGSAMTPQTLSESLRRLEGLFGGCRVMIMLRNPLTWVPSLYLQQLKKRFVKAEEQVPKGGRHLESVEQWFQRKSRDTGPAKLLAYADNIRAAAEVLGKPNVGVFLFEDLVVDSNGYYNKICDFLGIDVEECRSLTANQRQNQGMTVAQLAELQRIDAAWWSRVSWRFKSRVDRRRQLENGCGTQGVESAAARVDLPKALIRRIEEETRIPHRWLMAEFGLDLAQHGYPL
jgi:hypothetical protein